MRKVLTPAQREFRHWIIERENVRLLKEANEPRPWSEDPIIAGTHFTNVNREDDYVTRWIRNKFTYRGSEPLHAVNMIVARFFNLPDMLKELGPFDGKDMYSYIGNLYKIVERRKKQGLNCWNGAYIISSTGRSIPKEQHCAEVIANAWKELEPLGRKKTMDLCEWHDHLTALYGIAGFMSGQIIADLKNTFESRTYLASDWAEWSVWGPGSLRGSCYFAGDDLKTSCSQAEWEERIEFVRKTIWLYLPSRVQRRIVCNQNLQNCLCEYSKYMKIKHFNGRAKRRYTDGRSSKN